MVQVYKIGIPEEISNLYYKGYELSNEQDKHPEALTKYEEVLNWIESCKIPFHNNTDWEWRSRLYSAKGYAYSKLGEIEKAFEAFKKSFYWSTKLRGKDGSHNFFRYSSIGKFVLQDLINKEITALSPDLFNDPVDCPIFSILRRLRDEKKIDYDNKPLEKAYGYLKICSFVSNWYVNKDIGEEDKPKKNVTNEEFGNILMWSHYADKHQGVCIKYNINAEFLNNISSDTVTTRFIDVDYKEGYTNYNRNTYTLEETFATKNIVWSYENEVRLIHYDPNCDSPVKALPLDENGNVEAVYFGLKCPQKDIETIRGILTEDVAYFQMKEDDEDIFKLVEAPLNQKAEALLAAAAVAVTASVTVG